MAEAFDLAGKRVFVAGHTGMVGQALVRRLASENCAILTTPRTETDLRRQGQVEAWMEANRPDVVFLAAATVGGILANDTRPADFLLDNLQIETNLIAAAHATGVRKLVFLGSSCVYPRDAPQPIPESALLTGPLEETNQWYAIGKIAGLKLCQAFRRQHGCDFIAAQPTNLYGPGDNFDLAASHVIPALMRKAHEAKLAGAKALPLWGTGAPLREFLHVDDLADALVFLVRHYSADDIINVGSGEEISIAGLARLIADIVGLKADLAFERTKPDGTPRKRLDIAKLTALGWSAKTPLQDGLAQTYRWFLNHAADARGVR